MYKHHLIYSKLTVLVVLSMFSHTLFAQDDFAFKLTEPTTNELTVKAYDEISVEITFNAEAVNEAGAYIAIMADGKMFRFIAATTMESPFMNIISAKEFSEGEHTVEYLLLPSGIKDQSKALAKVSMQLIIENSSFNTNVDIESFTQHIVETMRNNDVSAFESYCISQEGMDNIIQSIDGNTPKESGIKAELSSIDTEIATKELTANFIKLEKAFSEKGADISVVKLQNILEQNTKLEMSEFIGMGIRFVIGSANTTFIIRTNIFVTKEKAYLFDFKIEPGL
ncbi:MAG: hypothetical protein JEZ09_15330 [Salinivirgaceae bacterium]|nr:hypothetical protein [Salinivirgaceae bacterium]